MMVFHLQIWHYKNQLYLQLAVQTLAGLSVVNKVSTVIRVVGDDAE